MEYAPIAAAIGAGGYVGYRAGSSVRAAMPGYKRKAFGPNRQGFRRKIQRSHLGKVPRPIPGRSYSTKMATDREFVALHDLKTFDLSSVADTFDCFQIADVLNMPGLGRYTARYDRVRFHKLKVEWFATSYTVTAINTTSQSEKTTLTNKNVILRQKNCRFHNLQRSDGVNCGRSFDISKIAILGDHLNCDTEPPAGRVRPVACPLRRACIHTCPHSHARHTHVRH